MSPVTGVVGSTPDAILIDGLAVVDPAISSHAVGAEVPSPKLLPVLSHHRLLLPVTELVPLQKVI